MIISKRVALEGRSLSYLKPALNSVQVLLNARPPFGDYKMALWRMTGIPLQSASSRSIWVKNQYTSRDTALQTANNKKGRYSGGKMSDEIAEWGWEERSDGLSTSELKSIIYIMCATAVQTANNYSGR